MNLNFNDSCGRPISERGSKYSVSRYEWLSHPQSFKLALCERPSAMFFRFQNSGGMTALCKVQCTKVFEFCARESAQVFGGLSYTRGGLGEKVERLNREVFIRVSEILFAGYCRDSGSRSPERVSCGNVPVSSRRAVVSIVRLLRLCKTHFWY